MKELRKKHLCKKCLNAYKKLKKKEENNNGESIAYTLDYDIFSVNVEHKKTSEGVEEKHLCKKCLNTYKKLKKKEGDTNGA